jgi:hypothetical protein
MIFAMRSGAVLSCGLRDFFAEVFAGRSFAVVFFVTGMIVGEFTNPLLF